MFSSISHAWKLSNLVHSTIPCQNIQCTSIPNKFVTCSTVKSKRVSGNVNVIRKNAVNVVRVSVIACVIPRPSSSLEPSDLAPQCYSDSLKRPKRMIGKIVSFCRGSNSVNNNHCTGREKNNTILNGFNDYHIENTCLVSTMFWELLILLIFVNNNLFSDRDLAFSSYLTYNFFSSTLPLHRSPEIIAFNNRTIV